MRHARVWGLALAFGVGCDGGPSAPPVSSPVSPGAAPPSQAVPPSQPAVTVSFAEESVQVTEGEVTEIVLRYQVGELAGPINLAVAPLDGTTEPDDYELSPSEFQIPAGRNLEGTHALALTALRDHQIAEGDEELTLRLGLPSDVRSSVDSPLEITIADGGGSPCPGIRVWASPTTRTGGYYREFGTWIPTSISTTLRLITHVDAADVLFDWLGPYSTLAEDAAPEVTRLLVANFVDWQVEVSDGQAQHLIDVDWPSSREVRLRVRSGSSACGGEPEIVCREDGCELIP